MMHFLDFSLIYAHVSQNFVVAIYALFPQIFWDWKVESADFFAFRMYACNMAKIPVLVPTLLSFVWLPGILSVVVMGPPPTMRVLHIWQITYLKYLTEEHAMGPKFDFGRNTSDSASLAAGHFTCGGPVDQSVGPLWSNALSPSSVASGCCADDTTQNVPPWGHWPTAAFLGLYRLLYQEFHWLQSEFSFNPWSWRNVHLKIDLALKL